MRARYVIGRWSDWSEAVIFQILRQIWKITYRSTAYLGIFVPQFREFVRKSKHKASLRGNFDGTPLNVDIIMRYHERDSRENEYTK